MARAGTLRLFLIGEGLSFALASLVHRGLLVGGYAHQAASIAESVIASVLLVGCALSWLWPTRVRLIALAVQAFAVLGTLVGVLMIVIGVGPRTAPDVAYHVAILGVLVWGLLVGLWAPAEPRLASRPTA